MLFRLLCFWCRLWHFNHWQLGFVKDKHTELIGGACCKCGIFHVLGVKVMDTWEVGVQNGKRFEI